MHLHMATRDDYPFRHSPCGVSEADEPVLDWADFLRFLHSWELEDDPPLPCDTCLPIACEVVTLLN
jgi:hypothetical protein